MGTLPRYFPTLTSYQTKTMMKAVALLFTLLVTHQAFCFKMNNEEERAFQEAARAFSEADAERSDDGEAMAMMRASTCDDDCGSGEDWNCRSKGGLDKVFCYRDCMKSDAKADARVACKDCAICKVQEKGCEDPCGRCANKLKECKNNCHNLPFDALKVACFIACMRDAGSCLECRDCMRNN